MDNPLERLDALGRMAEEVDAANPSPQQQQAQDKQAKEEVALDAAAKSWGMIPYSLGGTLAILAPELREVYTEKACYEWGMAAAAVSKKYGWDSPEGMPELALAAATIGFALPSVVIVSGRLKQLREGKVEGWLGKVGVWWRARKAKKAAATAQAERAEPGAVAEAAA